MVNEVYDLTAACEERHRRFVQRVARSGLVWGLKSKNGWATCPSHEVDDEGNELTVLVFWSDRAYARRCISEDWVGYEPTSIPLDQFLDRWLPGMAADGVLAGTNWTPSLVGLEVDPLTLGDELIAELRTVESPAKRSKP